MVTPTRVNVTLYIHCLSCWFHVRALAHDFIKLVCMKIQVPLLNYVLRVKVKDSRNRPGVAQSVPGGLGSQISWHSAHEGGEVVSLTHRPPLPPGIFLVLIFTRGWVGPRAMVRSEGNVSLKNPLTPPGIDAGTVRLVAQHLNHYATPGHTYYRYLRFISYRVAYNMSVLGSYKHL
jgi:hypothetical protein